jgi:hypothetical protein
LKKKEEKEKEKEKEGGRLTTRIKSKFSVNQMVSAFISSFQKK